MTTATKPLAPVVPGHCRYPECTNPARGKDHEVPGRRPGYCGQEVPEDHGDGTTVLIRHTAMTAFRRRSQLAGEPDAGARPVTTAVGRASAIRDDTLAAMGRLAGQLASALDQLAALGEQLTAAADPEAAEAQAEAVRAEAAAQTELARAEAAGQASARHAAELDAAEARAAAVEALTAMEEAVRAREQAEAAARRTAEELREARADAAAQTAHAEAAIAAARGEAETAVTAARAEAQAARLEAASAIEQHQRQHAAELAVVTTRLEAANGTIAELRGQLSRVNAALDTERAEQRKTVSLLHDLVASREPSARPESVASKSPGRRRAPRAASAPGQLPLGS